MVDWEYNLKEQGVEGVVGLEEEYSLGEVVEEEGVVD